MGSFLRVFFLQFLLLVCLKLFNTSEGVPQFLKFEPLEQSTEDIAGTRTKAENPIMGTLKMIEEIIPAGLGSLRSLTSPIQSFLSQISEAVGGTAIVSPLKIKAQSIADTEDEYILCCGDCDEFDYDCHSICEPCFQGEGIKRKMRKESKNSTYTTYEVDKGYTYLDGPIYAGVPQGPITIDQHRKPKRYSTDSWIPIEETRISNDYDTPNYYSNYNTDDSLSLYSNRLGQNRHVFPSYATDDTYSNSRIIGRMPIEKSVASIVPRIESFLPSGLPQRTEIFGRFGGSRGESHVPVVNYSTVCCSDCKPYDLQCYAVCQKTGCFSIGMCQKSVEGVYSAYCQEKCNVLSGYSSVPEFVPEEGCRAMCSGGVQRLCERNMCRDHGCEDPNCILEAPHMCG